MNITVCGSFGFGNAGDEAIPLAVADMLDVLGFNSNINILTRFDSPDMRSVIGMGLRDNAKRLNLHQQPLLFSGGGIVEASLNSTVNRCHSFIKKLPSGSVRFFGASVDAGVHYAVADRIRHVLLMRSTGTVYVRDVYSEATVRKYFPFVDVETIGDLVLWLRPSSLTESIPRLPVRYLAVVLAPRWKDDTDWVIWLANELRGAAKELDAAVVFVPMSCQHDDDRVEHRRISMCLRELGGVDEIIEIEVPLSPREVAAILAGSVMTVAMRLHGCVMAYAQRRPFIALAYHPKIGGFIKTIRADNALLPRNLPAGQTDRVYGYKFSDLGLKDGDLSGSIRDVIETMDFSVLDELKSRSLNVLSAIISKWA